MEWLTVKKVLIGVVIGVVVLGVIAGAGLAIDASDGSIDAFDDEKWEASGGDGIIEVGDPAFEAPTTTLPPLPTTTLLPVVTPDEAKAVEALIGQTQWILDLSGSYEEEWPDGDMPDEYRQTLEQHHREIGGFWYTLRDEYPHSPLQKAYGLMGNAHQNWMAMYGPAYPLGADEMMYSGIAHMTEATELLAEYGFIA